MNALELTPTEYSIARKVAFRVGRNWSGVGLEDVQQELLLWMVEHHDRVCGFRELDYYEAMLTVALRRVAAAYCAKEQERFAGAPLTAGYEYQIPLIREALKLMFHTPDINQVRVHPVTEAPLGRLNDDSLPQAVLADIKGAYEDLPDTFKEVLQYHFDFDLSLDVIGKLYGISRSAAKKRIDRALRRLQSRLG